MFVVKRSWHSKTAETLIWIVTCQCEKADADLGSIQPDSSSHEGRLSPRAVQTKTSHSLHRKKCWEKHTAHGTQNSALGQVCLSSRFYSHAITCRVKIDINLKFCVIFFIILVIFILNVMNSFRSMLSRENLFSVFGEFLFKKHYNLSKLLRLGI